MFVAEDFELFALTPFLPLSVVIYSVWICLYFTLTVLAISSLTRSTRVAGAGFGALALGSKVIFVGLSRLRVVQPPAFLSMIDSTVDSGHLFFGNAASANTPFLSIAAMVSLMLASLARPPLALELGRGVLVSTINHVIALDAVSRWYGTVLGLSRVSLTFDAGVTALLGPNGAGKSTLLKLVTGLLRPSSGSVTVFGATPFANTDVYQKLGLVPEEEEFQARVSAIDWLEYLMRLHAFDEQAARARAEKALSDVGLESAGARRVTTFSRGMKPEAPHRASDGARSRDSRSRRASHRARPRRPARSNRLDPRLGSSRQDGSRFESHSS